jgi:hypothetical protein
MKSILHLCIAFAVLIGFLIWGHEVLWAIFFMAVGVVLIGFEIWSCLHDDKVSLSGKFWELDIKHPKVAHILIAVMSLFWMYLMAHLLWRW